MDTQSLFLFDIAEQLLPLFLRSNQKELGNEKGVFMAVMKRNGGSIQEYAETKLIGVVPDKDELEKIESYAREKVYRLFDLSNMGHGDISSFESEDIPKKMFGGGIKTKDYFISVSGFPPHLDQKFVLLVSLIANQMSFRKAGEIDENTFEKQKKWVLN